MIPVPGCALDNHFAQVGSDLPGHFQLATDRQWLSGFPLEGLLRDLQSSVCLDACLAPLQRPGALFNIEADPGSRIDTAEAKVGCGQEAQTVSALSLWPWIDSLQSFLLTSPQLSTAIRSTREFHPGGPLRGLTSP